MRTRLYSSEDYPKILPWWTRRDATPIPPQLLEGMGVVVEAPDGVLLASAWLYVERGGRLAWLAWTITNPDNSPLTSAKALRILLGAMDELADVLGVPMIYAQIQQPSLKRLFESCGFEATHQSTQLLKICQQSQP